LTQEQIVVIQSNPADLHAWHQTVAPWLTLLTPAALIGIAWRLRGYIDTLVNNHLYHAKLEIIDAVKLGVKEETMQHQNIIDAVREANADTATAVRQSGDRIVDTLIALKK
jgi:hypothetical protein